MSLALKPSTNSSEGAALGTHTAARSNAADGPSSGSDKFGEAFASALHGNDSQVRSPKSDKSPAQAAAKPPSKQASATNSQPAVAQPKQADKQAVAALAAAIVAVPETLVSAPVKDPTPDAKANVQTDSSISVETPGKEKDDKDKKVQPESSQSDVSAVAAMVTPVLAAIPMQPALPVVASSKDAPVPATSKSDAGTPQPVLSVPQPVLKDQPAVQAAPVPVTDVRTGSEAFAMTLKPKLPVQNTAGNTSKGPILVSEQNGRAAAQSTSATPISAAAPAKAAVPAVSPMEALNSQGRGNAPDQTAQPVKTRISSATNISSNTPFSLTASADAESAAKSRDKDEPVLPHARVGEADAGKQDLAGFGSTLAPAVKDAKSAEAASDVRPATQLSQVQDSGPIAGAAKEVAIRLQSESGETINVKLVDQGGQVQVTVRSTDPDAASALRQDLSSLTSSLDKAGWKPEISMGAGNSFEPMAQASHQERGSQDGTPGNRQQEWQQETPKRRPSVADVWDEILTSQTA